MKTALGNHGVHCEGAAITKDCELKCLQPEAEAEAEAGPMPVEVPGEVPGPKRPDEPSEEPMGVDNDDDEATVSAAME